MRSILRKTLSVVLAVAMLVSLSAMAFAMSFDDPAFSLLTDENADGTLTITGYSADAVLEDGKLILRGLLDMFDETTEMKWDIVAVAASAFRYDPLKESPQMTFFEGIKEITVEENIKNIGKRAFSTLPNLEKVTFEDDVVLDEYAFENCANLKTVVFKKDAKIADTSFAGCSALETFEVSDDSYIEASANALADTAYVKGYPIDFVMIGSTLVYYKGNDAVVTLPLNVKTIGASAFEGNKQLKKIIFSKNVTKIGAKAFKDCVNLSDIVYSDFGEIEEYGADCFANTAYYNDFDGDFWIVGDTLIKYLGEDEAYVSIPNTVKAIAADAFDGCYASKDPDGYTFVIDAIFIPASVTEFGENCFGLAELEDGTHYVPTLYVYSGTPSEQAVKDAGYTAELMPRLGDGDNNGVIEPADARLALRMSLKLDTGYEPMIKHAADIDCSKEVNADDAREILRVAVGLDYTPEQLLYVPLSKLEILMTYMDAMNALAKSGAGYTKTTTNTVTGVDMSHEGRIHLYNTLANKGYTNSKVVYAHDTAEARNNINYCTTYSTDLIQSATCLVKDGKYEITIKFYNTVDNIGCSDVAKLFPVQILPTYEKAFRGNSWWTPLADDDYHYQGISKFDLTYTNPTITLTVDADDLKLDDFMMSCGYRFNIDGFISGIAISSRGYKTGDATLDRLDTVKYSDFVYTAESIPVD